ncbi:hypothetical protein C4F50_04480 [Flavobacterium sp. KB82]|uniref:Uncharacterized protein n=1 Tax=Flavobacterium hungaricum TaxID=2082725 RepID=A0ABR9TGP0_9FLAO|nr:hypothetical protein [Flavobacterium hungaricum]
MRGTIDNVKLFGASTPLRLTKKKERTISNELFYFSIISNFISRRFKKDLSRYRRLFKHKIKKNLLKSVKSA